MKKKLPITAILPCKDNLFELERHIETCRLWWDRVEKIVVVDSSNDGSLDFLRQNLPHKKTEFHSVPPGLYEAWNFGASRANSTYCYYATVGDGITAAELEYLLTGIEENSGDLIVAAPKMCAGWEGEEIEEKWPIHHIAPALAKHQLDYLKFPNELLTCISCSLAPRSMIGSSASNLYRTAFLQEHFWPVEFGHAGDAAWLCRWSGIIALIVAAKPTGSFRRHSQPRHVDAKPHAEISKKIRKEACLAATRQNQTFPLKNSPLHLGVLNALRLWNDELWDNIASLSDAPPPGKIYEEMLENQGLDQNFLKEYLSMMRQFKKLDHLHKETIEKIKKDIAAEREYFARLQNAHDEMTGYVHLLEERLNHPIVRAVGRFVNPKP
jgi:glycosyltransferase involved in cell wall biosynthesis